MELKYSSCLLLIFASEAEHILFCCAILRFPALVRRFKGGFIEFHMMMFRQQSKSKDIVFGNINICGTLKLHQHTMPLFVHDKADVYRFNIHFTNNKEPYSVPDFETVIV